MRLRPTLLILTLALLASSQASAQIYTCTAEDGTRVFSDQKCGPDAKVVPNISSRRAPSSSANSNAPKPTPAATRAPVVRTSPEELESLATACNAGDVKACNEWTRSGGPKQLKANEQKLEQSCETGSLEACEERYCSAGATQQCRAKVFAAAGASGGNWYLRRMGARDASGASTYFVRCLADGDLHMRDIVLTCAANAGPTRCQGPEAASAAPTMSQAAANSCQSSP
jgi:hypothetical protein